MDDGRVGSSPGIKKDIAALLAKIKTSSQVGREWFDKGTSTIDAVFVVSASFGAFERQQLIAAVASMGGISIMGLVNSSTAAALTHTLHAFPTTPGGNPPGARVVLVYDMGSRFTSVSLCLSGDTGVKVLATVGDSRLGGDAFDEKMSEWLASDFHKRHPDIDLAASSKAMNRLREACKAAKQQLSNAKEARVYVNSLHECVDCNTSITREKFESLCAPLFVRAVEPVREVLSEARLHESTVAELVLVGGSSRVPKLRETIVQALGGRVEVCRWLNPTEAAVYGAAMQAGELLWLVGIESNE